ncbi:MAG: energy transducer TonB [Robiginitomaculum sp.]
MSREIDISSQSKPSQAKPSQAASKGGDGSRTRYAFTLAIITAIALAGFAFSKLLDRAAEDAGTRISIPTRPAALVYAQADAIETPTLRLRALRNFAAAYPDTEQASLASEQIETLETAEHEQWLAVSEIFYDVRKSSVIKREALGAFRAQWDGGTYADDIIRMDAQIEEAAPKRRTINEATGKVPGLADSDIHLPAQDTTSLQAQSSDSLAGGAPQPQPQTRFPLAQTFPIETTPAAPAAIIVEAKVKKSARPRYPSRARTRGIEAMVTVSMDIGADGKVKDARVIKAASGKYAADFGRAAVRAAKRTRFHPKTIDGVASPTNGRTQDYRFRIED